MILAPTFSFLHLHKSGGSFVGKVLIEHVPGARRVGHHLPASQLPADHAHLPVLGVVRSPWAYYASWFAFQAQHREYTWRLFSRDGTLGFPETTRRMLMASDDDALIDALVQAAPAAFTNRRSNLTKTCIEQARGAGCGWYTFLFRRMYGALPVTFLRLEHLRTDLLAFLRAMNLATPAAERAVLTAPAENVTTHPPARTLYPPDLRDLVAARDADVVARFGATW